MGLYSFNVNGSDFTCSNSNLVVLSVCSAFLFTFFHLGVPKYYSSHFADLTFCSLGSYHECLTINTWIDDPDWAPVPLQCTHTNQNFTCVWSAMARIRGLGEGVEYICLSNTCSLVVNLCCLICLTLIRWWQV